MDNRINAAGKRIIAAILSACLAFGLFSASYGADEPPSATRLFGAGNYGDYRLQGGTKIQVAYNNSSFTVDDIVVKPANSSLGSVTLVGGAPGDKNSPLNEVESVVYTSSGGSVAVAVEQLRGAQLARDNIVLFADSRPGWPYCEVEIPWDCFEGGRSGCAPGTGATYLLGNPDTGKHTQNADSYTDAGALFYYHREGSPIEEGRYHIYTKYGQNLIIESEYTVDIRTTSLGTWEGADYARAGGSYIRSGGAYMAGTAISLTAAEPSKGTGAAYHAVVDSGMIYADCKSRATFAMPGDTLFFDPSDPDVVRNADFGDYRDFGFRVVGVRGSALAGGGAKGTVNYGVVGASAGGQGADGTFVVDIDSDTDLASGELEIDIEIFSRRGTGFEVERSATPATVRVEVTDKPEEGYSITINPTANGTVAVSGGLAAARPGTPIDLIVAPDTGYRLKAGTLKANGEAVSGTRFAMPDGPVAIAAEFEPMPGNRLALESLLANAAAIGRAAFTPESAAALDAAVLAAEALLEDEQAAQGALDVAAGAVEAAIDGLALVVGLKDCEPLAALLLEYAKLDSSLYTPESWQALADLMAEAWQYVLGEQAETQRQALGGLAEPVAPDEPTKPQAAGAAAELAGPAGSDARAEPAEPSYPGNPAGLHGAQAGLQDPGDPSEPASLQEPSAPGAPAEPRGPIDPNEPAGTQAPSDPSVSGNPAGPLGASAWPQGQAEILALEAGQELVPMATSLKPEVRDWIARLIAKREELVLAPAAAPGPQKGITAGVYATPATKELIAERIDGAASAEFTVSGLNLQNVGIVALNFSVKDAAVGEPALSIPDGLKGADRESGEDDLARIAHYADITPEGSEDGYRTYSVQIHATGKDFSVADGAPILEVSLPLKENARQTVSLLLGKLDIVFYDSGFENGETGIQAIERIAPPAASALVLIRSRFDVNLDGEVTLLDVNMVRQNMGAAADGQGSWPSEAAMRCDLGGDDVSEPGSDLPDGRIDARDLTLAMAKYMLENGI
ncbi:MAG: hypothetical protein LBL83_08240 [Clostridiales bacterium]|nr:hypothetical protein [Clostridiales bacterium]